MHVYKFRLLSDESEDFIRDIEIQAAQTFENFHHAICECSGLNEKELASFHICDQKWSKKKEITLIDMLDGEDQQEKDKVVEETHIMSDSLIRDFIKEPHQRLMYEYDFLNMKTFFIELLSVHIQKDNGPYPRCSLRKGELVKEVIPMPITGEIDEDITEQLLRDFDEILNDTADYKPDNDNFE
jgi:hypothetical protein